MEPLLPGPGAHPGILGAAGVVASGTHVDLFFLWSFHGQFQSYGTRAVGIPGALLVPIQGFQLDHNRSSWFSFCLTARKNHSLGPCNDSSPTLPSIPPGNSKGSAYLQEQPPCLRSQHFQPHFPADSISAKETEFPEVSHQE